MQVSDGFISMKRRTILVGEGYEQIAGMRKLLFGELGFSRVLLEEKFP